MRFLLALTLCCSAVTDQTFSQERDINQTEMLATTFLLPGSGLMYYDEPLLSWGMFAAQGIALVALLDGIHRDETAQTNNAIASLAILKIIDVGWTIKLMKPNSGPPQLGVEIPIK
jgi:hypothetical protein